MDLPLPVIVNRPEHALPAALHFYCDLLKSKIMGLLLTTGEYGYHTTIYYLPYLLNLFQIIIIFF